jgi:cytochrome c peroxidase
MTTRRLLIAAALTTLGACSKQEATPYVWHLPDGFPQPKVPDTNPMSEAKVALGRFLFYDTRVSFSQSRACATCHVQALGFSSGTTKGFGLTGPTRRNVIALSVPAYMSTYLWADPTCTAIEDVIGQTLVDPDEFGGAGQESAIAHRLAADARYPPLFTDAFPGESISFEVIGKAIASFVRTISSGDSPHDRYQRGIPGSLSEAALRGRDLFFSERLECYHCHGGFTFSDSVSHQNLAISSTNFSNTGLYDVDDQGSYPAEDQGLIEVTHDASDMGKFKAPSLRNVAKSAPYMHDGSIATLREVLDAYTAGGRSALDGGTLSPNLSPFVVQATLTEAEKTDVLAFLESLTDEAFLTDPKYSNPLQ